MMEGIIMFMLLFLWTFSVTPLQRLLLEMRKA